MADPAPEAERREHNFPRTFLVGCSDPSKGRNRVFAANSARPYAGLPRIARDRPAPIITTGGQALVGYRLWPDNQDHSHLDCRRAIDRLLPGSVSPGLGMQSRRPNLAGTQRCNVSTRLLGWISANVALFSRTAARFGRLHYCCEATPLVMAFIRSSSHLAMSATTTGERLHARASSRVSKRRYLGFPGCPLCVRKRSNSKSVLYGSPVPAHPAGGRPAPKRYRTPLITQRHQPAHSHSCCSAKRRHNYPTVAAPSSITR